VRAEALCAEAAQDEPELEGAEAAAEGEVPVAVVDDGAGVGVGGAQEGRGDVEGREVRAGADPEGGGVKVDEAPLVVLLSKERGMGGRRSPCEN
jgi:hypothetical protein